MVLWLLGGPRAFSCTCSVLGFPWLRQKSVISFVGLQLRFRNPVRRVPEPGFKVTDPPRGLGGKGAESSLFLGADVQGPELE